MNNQLANVEKLRRDIEYYDYLYFVKGQPETSNAEYDRLYAELVRIEKENPELIVPYSPTQKVGGQVLEEFDHLKHTIPMRGLDNTYSAEEIHAFHKRVIKLLGHDRVEYCVEPKIDGVSISVRYENGILTRALTRGTGYMGDDVTQNIKTIKSVPSRLFGDNPPSVWEARGEVFMNKETFANLNKEREKRGKPLYANARNTTAGTLKLLDSREVARRPLDVLFYTCGDVQGANIKTQEELLSTMNGLGLKTQDFFRVGRTMDEVLSAIRELELLRDKILFDLDGAVIKVNRMDFQKSLGFTAKAPRWAIAYKYAAEKAVTKVKEVIFQVGRTGTITPVALLEPVALSGSTVSRATLHNFDEIQRKDIRKGDYVEVEKAGEIIPAVLRSFKERRTGDEEPIDLLINCPSCNMSLVKSDSEVALRCVNFECPQQVKGRLLHFSSRGAMDIETLGEALINLLVENGFVHNPANLYTLSEEQIEKLSKFEGLGEKSVQKLITKIEASKKNPPWRLLFGLGIRYIGAKASRTLLDYFHDIEKIASASVEELTQVEEIGPTMAESIFNFFRNERNREMVQVLRNSGVNFVISQKRKSDSSSMWAGKTCVLTGKLVTMTRDEAKEILTSLGANVTGSVSAKTDYIIVGESPGSKLATAERFGVKIISENQFVEWIKS